MSKFDIVTVDSFHKPARFVNKVYLHCSASDNPAHDNPMTVEVWHLQRGFHEIGYHYYIDKHGRLWEGRNVEIIPAAQEGNNGGSIAVCAGGLAEFTDVELAMVRELCQKINVTMDGRVSFHGHCEVSTKSCPVYDYKHLLELNDQGKMPIGGQP